MTSSCLGGCKGGAGADQNQSWAAVLNCGHGLALQCPSCSGFAPVFTCCEIWSRFGRFLEEVGGCCPAHTHQAHTTSSWDHPIPALCYLHPSCTSPSLHGKHPHSSGSSTLNEIELSPSHGRGKLFKVEWQQAWELFMGSAQLGPFSRPRREEYSCMSSHHNRRTSHLTMAQDGLFC